jgi:hypothetical protein
MRGKRLDLALSLTNIIRLKVCGGTDDDRRSSCHLLKTRIRMTLTVRIVLIKDTTAVYSLSFRCKSGRFSSRFATSFCYMVRVRVRG